MEKQAANINVNLYLKINGMTLDEFQKEIEKLSHLLDEMKQLSMFRDEEDMTSSEINGIHISHAPYFEALRQQARKDEGTD
ncbi:hypothetical protein [Levyella massiliensis]|uniref:hypothetical protein n=1 Tax=Levyella massiliensis TaxID=938289 RepID=UPI0024AE1540|nr:hypothetical protein [Levyella massiliensis]